MANWLCSDSSGSDDEEDEEEAELMRELAKIRAERCMFGVIDLWLFLVLFVGRPRRLRRRRLNRLRRRKRRGNRSLLGTLSYKVTSGEGEVSF